MAELLKLCVEKNIHIAIATQHDNETFIKHCLGQIGGEAVVAKLHVVTTETYDRGKYGSTDLKANMIKQLVDEIHSSVGERIECGSILFIDDDQVNIEVVWRELPSVEAIHAPSSIRDVAYLDRAFERARAQSEPAPGSLAGGGRMRLMPDRAAEEDHGLKEGSCQLPCVVS